jgi:hypothetical protein
MKIKRAAASSIREPVVSYQYQFIHPMKSRLLPEHPSDQIRITVKAALAVLIANNLSTLVLNITILSSSTTQRIVRI